MWYDLVGGWSGHSQCLSGDSSALMDLHWPCSCTAKSSILFIGSVSHYLSLFCEAFSWMILDSSCFPLFHSGQVFHQLVCPLPQIFSNLTTLFYPVFLSLFHAPLGVVVHFLVFLRSFRLKFFLSQFSPFVAQIKHFCSDPGFFLLTMFAKDLTGCFSHCCVEGGDHWIPVCIFIVHDSERCKLSAYLSLEGFQHIGIFQLFEVKLESCVLACWLFSGEGGRS